MGHMKGLFANCLNMHQASSRLGNQHRLQWSMMNVRNGDGHDALVRDYCMWGISGTAFAPQVGEVLSFFVCAQSLSINMQNLECL